MTKKHLIVGLTTIVIIIIAVVFTQSDNNQKLDTMNQSVQGASQTIVNDSDNAQVEIINMVARKWLFEPDTITVNQGDVVKLSITSIDVAHGIRLPDFGVSSFLVPGQVTEIEFVASKSGVFPFFCNVACGVGHGGMNGKIIVN